MKTIKMTIFIAVLTVLTFLLLSCSGETGGENVTTEPELTLGELPDYSDAHAEDAPYIVFSADLEPISAERIEKVRQALYSMAYKSELAVQNEILKDSELDENAKYDKAHSAAKLYAQGYKSALMNPDNLLINDYYTWICNYSARYYGTVGGCEIVCLATFIDKSSVYELGGVKIESPNPIYLFACKEKEMIPLAEAYEREWLEPVDILLISKRNGDFNTYWEENCSNFEAGRSYVKYISELEDLSEETMDEIYGYMYPDVRGKTYSSMVDNLNATYGDKYSAEKIEAIASFKAEKAEKQALYSFLRKANTHYIGWRYYGIIGGYAVFAEVADTNNVKIYRLGEYEIRFGNGTEMWIYSTETGKVELEEAYKNGLLTDVDVAKISERHEAYNNYIFKK